MAENKWPLLDKEACRAKQMQSPTYTDIREEKHANKQNSSDICSNSKYSHVEAPYQNHQTQRK